VLHRHPGLKVIAAHGAWLMTQDAQLDYLRYLLATYPNFNIDVAATFQYSNLPSYDNLRDFYVSQQDRIVWGADNVAALTDKTENGFRKKYIDWFRFLETDELLADVTTANKKPMRGLGLPREVLEKIYFRNALRLYPPAVATAFQRHRPPSP
jgi:predicted TIM-barrel fold metal-dependent hydrolase